jgi:hypothetical protein
LWNRPLAYRAKTDDDLSRKKEEEGGEDLEDAADGTKST